MFGSLITTWPKALKALVRKATTPVSSETKILERIESKF
jgi:hypothetical protein